MDASERKENLIAHLKQEGYLKTPAVESAFRKIPRENFLPKELEASAYSDHPLPIGSGQTISAPHMVAIMTELIEPKSTDTILEIGAGSGYQAAILSTLVNKIYTIEFYPELASLAKKNLSRTGIKNVEVIPADGSKGYPEKAPYDKIIVTCAIPMEVFSSLGKQLKESGIIVAPVGPAYGIQMLTTARKVKGSLKKKEYFGCVFVPLQPFPGKG
ncbi:MAG: protein-L-isoaspartate(D-aspartate) O-methyltransferase [Candidatus Aenigmarchaeota archaeon]|nr:protein-L-isoaspartate(D-aspartate) O-methyltransferase [Candidatus Aenigmarchaeota archaeon]